jgi:8-oxo-dGTP pyrophosphatase MutT (NUDIX family)
MPLPMPQRVLEMGFYYHYKHDPEGPVNNYAYEVISVGFHTEDDCRPGPRAPRFYFCRDIVHYDATMSQNFSQIQNQILSRLKNAKSLRYTEMQPGKVPNDLYNYHLQFLVKKGFVEKSGEGYGLSETGIKYMADPHTGTASISSLFKINVITIVSRTGKDGIEILSQVRRSNPSYGKVGVMGGVVLKGELIEPAATRKLKQETGLDASFKLVGCERRIMYRGGDLFSDVMFPIAYADASSGTLESDTAFGHNMWLPIEQAITNEDTEYDSITAIVTVLRAIRDGSIEKLPFFFEENIQSDLIAG